MHVLLPQKLCSIMAEFKKNCNTDIEDLHCNCNKNGNVVTVLPKQMKSCSCGIIALLITINTVLALTGIILGLFAIIRFQQIETSITSLHKRSSLSQENSNDAIQSRLIDEIVKASNTFSRVMSSGNLTGPPGNK